MIEYEHRSSSGNAAKAFGRERNPHRRKRPAADPPKGGPTLLETRQDQDGERSDDEGRGQHDPPPAGIENVARQPRSASDLRSDPRHRQANELPPHWTPRRPDAAGLIKILCGAAADLAARRLWDRTRRRKDDLVRRRAGRVSHDLVRPRLQRRSPRRIRFPRLGEDDDALGARARIGDAEHRDAALADPRNARDGFLDLLRIEMAARANDDVLDTAGDVDIASRHVGAIPAVEPTTANELPGFGFVAEIAARGRRAAEFKPSLPTFAEFVTGFVHNTNFMIRQRLPARDDLEQFRIVRLCRLGQAMSAEPFAVDLIDDREPAERREREPDRTFCEAVDRRHRPREEAVPAKPIDEPPQCLSAD